MQEPNFVCVGSAKYGCDAFTQGSNGKLVDADTALSDISVPLCWAGSHKETLYKHCIENERKFYNLDTGYFGNVKRKELIRVSINELQDQGPIVDRSRDRLQHLNVQVENFVRGETIVIVPPDEKISHVFKLPDSWLIDLQTEITKYTNRPIRIRARPQSRSLRLITDNFQNFIKQDTYLVIGYSSNALVESIIAGIPVISLGHSATKSFSNYQLQDIESVPAVDQARREAWMRHLSYKQFTYQELSNGTAWKLLTAVPGSIGSGSKISTEL